MPGEEASYTLPLVSLHWHCAWLSVPQTQSLGTWRLQTLKA